MFIISRNCSAHEFAAKGKTVLPIRELQRFKFFQSQQNIVKAYNSEICTAEFRCGTAKIASSAFFASTSNLSLPEAAAISFRMLNFSVTAPVSTTLRSSPPNAGVRLLSISSISSSTHSSIILPVESKYVSFPTLISRSFF